MDAHFGPRETPRVPPTQTETALRAHLRSHNAGVLTASGMALIFSTLGWALLYGVSYWVTMLALAVAHDGTSARPVAFDAVFLGTAGVLLLAARVDQFLFPSERAADERPPVEHFADVLFFVPRFTMSCWQNLGALARLTAAEFPHAARLLDALDSESRVSLQELPAQLPGERERTRILTALQVASLIEQRREHDVTWLQLSALAPEVFRGKSCALPASGDPLAGVQQVKVIPRARLLRSRPEKKE